MLTATRVTVGRRSSRSVGKKGTRKRPRRQDKNAQKKKEQIHAKYALLCVACKDPEKKITATLDALTEKLTVAVIRRLGGTN